MRIDRLARLWSAAMGFYLRWEDRNARRLSGWPVRRRWAVLVLVPTLVICCGGSVFGIPAAWVLRQTIEASQGAPSPDAAANSYLMALGYNNEDGLLPILDNENQHELLDQWRAYRDAITGTTPPPAKLDFGPLTVGPTQHNVAAVSVDVSATWRNADGRSLSYRSEAYTWRFSTREEGTEWLVSAVEAPTWCGGYVRLDACGKARSSKD